jgi:dUTP pyrophosphatase
MKMKIKRFDKGLPLPEYHTKGAAGFDLSAQSRVEIAPGATEHIFLNIAVEIPEGHFLLLAARGSLHKKGLAMRNDVGIIDSDFRGDEDHIRAVLFNFTDAPVVIERGNRIVQGIIVPFVRAEWDEVDEMKNKTRGAFGSTGTS